MNQVNMNYAEQFLKKEKDPMQMYLNISKRVDEKYKQFLKAKKKLEYIEALERC